MTRPATPKTRYAPRHCAVRVAEPKVEPSTPYLTVIANVAGPSTAVTSEPLIPLRTAQVMVWLVFLASLLSLVLLLAQDTLF